MTNLAEDLTEESSQFTEDLGEHTYCNVTRQFRLDRPHLMTLLFTFECNALTLILKSICIANLNKVCKKIALKDLMSHKSILH